MECSRNEGVFGDQSGAGSKFHGNQEKQASMGSYFHKDERKGLQSQR